MSVTPAVRGDSTVLKPLKPETAETVSSVSWRVAHTHTLIDFDPAVIEALGVTLWSSSALGPEAMGSKAMGQGTNLTLACRCAAVERLL